MRGFNSYVAIFLLSHLNRHWRSPTSDPEIQTCFRAQHHHVIQASIKFLIRSHTFAGIGDPSLNRMAASLRLRNRVSETSRSNIYLSFAQNPAMLETFLQVFFIRRDFFATCAVLFLTAREQNFGDILARLFLPPPQTSD